MRPPQRRAAQGAAAIGLVLGLFAISDTAEHWPRRAILDAIRFVESSDRPDPPDGDGGRAIGPYQIHEAYWKDAVGFDPSLGGSYQQCRERAYAERVVDAYMRRHASTAWAAGDAETIARVHNGGPRGATKDSTLGYWSKVRARLER